MIKIVSTVNSIFLFKIDYSFEELKDMHFANSAANCRGREATLLYDQNHPEYRQPHHISSP